jgi:hypothetical protein
MRRAASIPFRFGRPMSSSDDLELRPLQRGADKTPKRVKIIYQQKPN